MELKCFILEDNEADFKKLAEIVSCYPNTVVVNSYLKNYPYHKAKDLISFLNPNVFILDHELNDPNGKNGLDFFQEVVNPTVFGIFCSQHADKARDDDNLYINSKWVEKDARRDILTNRIHNKLGLAKDYFSRFNDAHKLTIDTGEEVYYINYDDISHFQAKKTTTLVHTLVYSKPIIMKYGINKLVEKFELEKFGFVMVHRSFAVNVFKISSIRYKANILSKKGIYLKTDNRVTLIPVGPKFIEGKKWEYLLERYKK